jgi:hypothetical protein
VRRRIQIETHSIVIFQLFDEHRAVADLKGLGWVRLQPMGTPDALKRRATGSRPQFNQFSLFGTRGDGRGDSHYILLVLPSERIAYKLYSLRRTTATPARQRNGRLRPSANVSVKPPVRNFLPNRLVTLRQPLEAYQCCRRLIAGSDRKIEQPLAPSTVSCKKFGSNQIASELQQVLCRIFGVDPRVVLGVNALAACTMLAGVGSSLSKLQRALASVSWNGLCPGNPDHDVSEAKVLLPGHAGCRIATFGLYCTATDGLHESQL